MWRESYTAGQSYLYYVGKCLPAWLGSYLSRTATNFRLWSIFSDILRSWSWTILDILDDSVSWNHYVPSTKCKWHASASYHNYLIHTLFYNCYVGELNSYLDYMVYMTPFDGRRLILRKSSYYSFIVVSKHDNTKQLCNYVRGMRRNYEDMTVDSYGRAIASCNRITILWVCVIPLLLTRTLCYKVMNCAVQRLQYRPWTQAVTRRSTLLQFAINTWTTTY